MRTHFTAPAVAALVLTAPAALAQALNGAPPADVGASVSQQKDSGAVPTENKPTTDTTVVAVNAGMQWATGNSELFAVTGGAKIDMRRGNNGFGGALVANYAESYVVPAGASAGAWQDTTRNLQAKLRYDRYLARNVSLFLQVTGTHDAFQATAFRLNIDPGVKYLFINKEETKLWAEVGYDFEFDDNYVDGEGFELTGTGARQVDATTSLPIVIMNTNTMHSVRAYAGFRHAFSKDVNLSAGLEYLQGLGGSDDGLPNLPAGFTDAEVLRSKINLVRSRINFDALLAARLVGGLSVGLGFTMKYNSDPLPGKVTVDTATTFTLIYSLTSPDDKDKKKAPPPPPPCEPCTNAPMNPPPVAPPAPPAPAFTALGNVTFDAQGALDASSKDAVKALVDTLKSYANLVIEVSGKKSEAGALRDAIVAGGVDSSRVTVTEKDGPISARITSK